MRLLLLSLTLTCFFLFPSEGDATTVCEKAAIKFTHNLSETGDENYSENHLTSKGVPRIFKWVFRDLVLHRLKFWLVQAVSKKTVFIAYQ